MKFINMTGRAITLPSITLQPEQEVDVMETILSNTVVSFWVESGDLFIEESKPEPTAAPETEPKAAPEEEKNKTKK